MLGRYFCLQTVSFTFAIECVEDLSLIEDENVTGPYQDLLCGMIIEREAGVPTSS
jgi:hypothetical protein